MPAKQYVILRFEKLKSVAEISGSCKHMTREDHADNADPGRLNLNRLLVGSDHPLNDVEAKLKGVWHRSDSVRAIEVLLTCSHEWFATAGNEDVDRWMNTGRDYLVGEFGDNLVHLQVHMDERTPHLTGLVVPIKNGRLNAKHYIGDRQKLARYQDRAARAFDDLGLSRGVRNSGATHETMKKFYAALDEPGDAPPAPELVPMFKKLAKESIANSQTAKEATARLRSLPLADVLTAIGMVRSERDKKRWVDGEERFAITFQGPKWYCHKSAHGKGGAIDLVQHILGCDFATARHWLVSRFDTTSVVADQVTAVERQAKEELADQPPVDFVPPTAVEAFWPDVYGYLVNERKIDPELVSTAHEHGLIYSDSRKNAVFLARDDEGNTVGAELRGTAAGSTFKGMALGSRKDSGFFQLGNPKAKQVMFCESAIDALSLIVVYLKASAKSLAQVLGKIRFVSTAGILREAPTIAEAATAICCYDADMAGDTAARGWDNRKRPFNNCKDWNEFLVTWTGPYRVDAVSPASPFQAAEPTQPEGGVGVENEPGQS